MENYYMELNDFKLTNVETLETTEYGTLKEMLDAATWKSSKVYTFDLHKAEKAISNYLKSEGYNPLNTSDLEDGITAKIGKLEFLVVGSSAERTCVNIRSRRTTVAQTNFLGLTNLFGSRATEEKIAAFALGEAPQSSEDITMGICMAIDNLLSQGHNSWTLSINAMNDLKNECFSREINGKKQYGYLNFLEMFPKLSNEIHEFVFSSFQGGLCYFNQNYKGTTMVKGKSYDVNSMYPSVMLDEFIPYGVPSYFKGKLAKPVINGKPVLHFQRVMILGLKLKEDGIPCIRNKEEANYYIEEDMLEIVLNHVDLEMLYDNYYFEDIEYIDGYKFRGRKHMFDRYINKWSEVKRNAADGSFERMYAKLMLNSAFGKFVSRTDRISDEWHEIKLGKMKGTILKKQSKDKTKVEGDSVYAPVGCYITSYARQRLIAAIKANKENFIYADTDSIYVKGEAKGLELDDTKFGAWKVENEFNKISIIGKKQYCIQKLDGSLKVVLAGCPSQVVGEVDTFEEFRLGKTMEYKVFNFDTQGKIYYKEQKYMIKDENIL